MILTPRFQYGKYAQKSIIQVAMVDPSYFLFMRDQRKAQSISDPLYLNIMECLGKLNGATPKVKCKYSGGCNRTAERITIASTEGQIPRGNFSKPGITGLSVSPEYVWCKEHDNCHIYEKAMPHDLKFGTIETFPDWPKWVRKEISDVIFECLGFSGSKTEKNCVDFYNSLQIKTPRTAAQIIKPIQGELF